MTKSILFEHGKMGAPNAKIMMLFFLLDLVLIYYKPVF